MTGLVLAFLAGGLTVMCWNGSWFLIDDLVARLRQPGFDRHADQAIAVTAEQEDVR